MEMLYSFVFICDRFFINRFKIDFLCVQNCINSLNFVFLCVQSMNLYRIKITFVQDQHFFL